MDELLKAQMEFAGRIQTQVADLEFCVQAMMSALVRLPAIDAPKLQSAFLEMCETQYKAPENVPKFLREIAATALLHGAAKL